MNPTQISLLLKPILHNYHIYTFSIVVLDENWKLVFWNQVWESSLSIIGMNLGAIAKN
jgi:hypothetical protein